MSTQDLIVTTLNKYSSQLYDNVLKNNALLSRLESKGQVQLLDGGSFIEEDLMYAENSTFKWYSGYELLETASSPVLTSAKFEWKQANANVIISGEEMRKNSGDKTRKHNLIESRVKVCEKTMKNRIGASLFSDGTASDGKEITGLQALISDSPTTGIIGGIDRSSNVWWRNQVYSFNAEQGIETDTTPDEKQFLKAMDELFIRCTRDEDMPTMIIADAKYYGLYKTACQNIRRITSASTADAGFRTLEYEGVPVYFDINCPENHMYFINTDYMFFKSHKDANFKLDKERLPYNQDASIYPMIFMGNLTISNCNLQGVLKA
jgi:hypothetical protein